MTGTKNLPLTVGLFALAAAIVFHAWWPSFKTDRDMDGCIATCVSRFQALESSREPIEPMGLQLLCESECRDFECY
jgi:hypothetical protein